MKPYHYSNLTNLRGKGIEGEHENEREVMHQDRNLLLPALEQHNKSMKQLKHILKHEVKWILLNMQRIIAIIIEFY